MNGISFQEFENSSMDQLYVKNFAGVKDMAKIDWKKMQESQAKALPQDFARNFQIPDISNRGALTNQYVPNASRQQITSGPPAHQDRPAPVPRREVPALNDLGTAMPGNTAVAHSWKPSQEAAQRSSQLALTAAAPAPREPQAPKPDPAKGSYVRWESN
eukprot:GEMP01030444.1.p1 GENE.GEMP01030444.1~~GEMP01030444.1.p1  ORF type:complete len:159 (+),score=34.46 GEMP01030444.1:66-542(+)